MPVRSRARVVHRALHAPNIPAWRRHARHRSGELRTRPGRAARPAEERAGAAALLGREDVRGGEAEDEREGGRADEDDPPAVGLADQAADDARGHDAGEQARYDGRDMAGAVVGGGAFGDQRDEELRDDGRGGGDEHGDREGGGPGGRGTGEQGRRGGHGEGGDQGTPVHAVAERGEEEQAGGVAELRDRGDPGHRRRGRAEVVGDEGEQRAREIDVGGRHRGADGDEDEEETVGGRGDRRSRRDLHRLSCGCGGHER